MFRSRQLLTTLTIVSTVLLGAKPCISSAQQSAASGVAIEWLIRSTLTDIPPAPALVGFGRLAFAPNTGTSLYATSGLELYYVESGTLTMQAEGPAQRGDRDSAGTSEGFGAEESVPVGTTVALEPGEHVLFSPNTPRELRNDGAEPTVLLVVQLTAITLTPAGQYIPPLPPGVPDSELPPALPNDLLPPPLPDLLADGVASALPTGGTQLELVRVTVEPDVQFSIPVGEGPVAVYVESGTLGMTTSSGNVELTRAASSSSASELPPEAAVPSEEGPPPPPPGQTAQAEMGEAPPPPSPSGPEVSPLNEEIPLVTGDTAIMQTDAVVEGRNSGSDPLRLLLLVTDAG